VTAPSPIVVTADAPSLGSHLAMLPGARRRVIRTQPGETVEDALALRLGPAVLRGAAAGGVGFGLVSTLLALFAGISPGVALGLGAAVGLTGGPFFGSLASYASAVRLSELVHGALGPAVSRTDVVLLVAWADEATTAAYRRRTSSGGPSAAGLVRSSTAGAALRPPATLALTEESQPEGDGEDHQRDTRDDDGV
jgi:hypothetical protein